MKRIEYFKSYTEDVEDQSLLQTIKIPKNLLFLSDKLPQPNYEKQNINKKNHSFTKKNQNDLPDIRMSAVKHIRKIKEDDPTISPNKQTQNKENISPEKRESSPKPPIEESRSIKYLQINLESKPKQPMPMIYDLPQVKSKKKNDQ
jgi:hypothetical protein